MRKNKAKHAKKTEFSKILLKQESWLIWITTISTLVLAYICVFKGFFNELPWLTVLVGLPWAAYGVSQVAYYDKAKKENTKGGIKYDTTVNQNLGIETSTDEPVG